MQHDTDKTFGEIHGSHHNFMRNLEDTINTALSDSSNEVPLNLRFIEAKPHEGDGFISGTVTEHRLTPLDEYKPNIAYTSVSYCWAHTLSRNNQKFPNHHIRDPPRLSRPIACPPDVFHRAIRFAQHQRCPRIWIDQECIDQKDPTDVERHLKIMHRVYKESKYTVAILSTPIRDAYSLEALLKVTRHRGPLAGRDLQMASVVAVNVLLEIPEDRWFRRTWAFQEKHCASSLHLLIPIDTRVRISSYFAHYLIGDDFCLPINEVGRLLKRILEEPFASAIADQWGSNSGLSLEDAVSHLGVWFNNAGQTPEATANMVWDEDRHLIHGAFAMMERCDNLVVSDRVSIFGNICDFPGRLLSNRIDNERFSYSTSLLALLLVNFYPTPEQRAEAVAKIAWHIRDHTLASVLETELFTDTSCILRSLDDHENGVSTDSNARTGRYLVLFFIGSMFTLQILTVVNVALRPRALI